MSASPALSKLPLNAPGGAERRLHRRYPIVLEVQYRATKGRAKRLGSGTTLDVSSRGVLFRAEDSLPAGSYVELALKWPFLLMGLHPLTLVMRGRVVRSDGRGVAVRTRDHELLVAGVASSRVRAPGERRSA
jgi:PilZ domain